MKKKMLNLWSLIVLGMIIVFGACSNDASEELPSAVSQFITQYFPGMSVKSYNVLSDNGCVVQLASGPTLRFDSENQWMDIDGNGARLPQVLTSCRPNCMNISRPRSSRLMYM